MKTFPLSLFPCVFLLLFFLITHSGSASSVEICQPSLCSSYGPVIRFPFWLPDHQSVRCGYPGFSVSCNNQNQTVLTIPSTGDFIVTLIDYEIQAIYLTDPDSCLPKKLLRLNLWGSPFNISFSTEYTLLNCSSLNMLVYEMEKSATKFPCLSGDNYTVFGVSSHWLEKHKLPESCRNVSTVGIPESLETFDGRMDLNKGLQLLWASPVCGLCESQGETCGYMSDVGLEVACSKPARKGLPRSAMYGIIIGVGIPGIVCVMGIACYISGKIRDYGRRRHANTELSIAIIPSQPVVIMTGLDEPTIASFPKTVLGESRRLPNSNDGTCPICLAEYLPKETIRTIPECNHYFHANCIDEWLKLNATCPLCRNSPDSSVTPCSSMSSTSSVASSA